MENNHFNTGEHIVALQTYEELVKGATYTVAGISYCSHCGCQNVILELIDKGFNAMGCTECGKTSMHTVNVGARRYKSSRFTRLTDAKQLEAISVALENYEEAAYYRDLQNKAHG